MIAPKQVIATILIAVSSYGIADSQNPRKPPPVPQPTVRVDVDFVTVNATVTDSRNRPFTDLRREHFQIWEDKVEQQIEHLSVEDAPISVGIIFDVSESMAQRIATARDAAVAFLRNGSPEDEYFLIEFSDRVTVAHEFSRDVATLQNQIAVKSAKGNTAMYDAVYLGLEKLKRGTNPRKALLLITDGEDNHSRYTASSIKEVLKEMNVEVYAIGITDYVPAPPRQPGRAALKELGAMSGGRTFFIDSVHELEDICLKVALLLKEAIRDRLQIQQCREGWEMAKDSDKSQSA